MEGSERDKELMGMVEEAVKGLRRHFDTVQIFATLYDEGAGETEEYESGGGNSAARSGQVMMWLDRLMEDGREVVRRRRGEE